MSAKEKSGRAAADHVLFIFDMQRESSFFALIAGACTQDELDEMRQAPADTIPYEIVACSRARAEVIVRRFICAMDEMAAAAEIAEKHGWEDLHLPPQNETPPGHTLIVALTADRDEENEDAGRVAIHFESRLLST